MNADKHGFFKLGLRQLFYLNIGAIHELPLQIEIPKH